MITAIKQFFAHRRALRRAYAALQQAAYDAATPERYSAGRYDIKRLVRWRYRRIESGHDLCNEICAMKEDIARLYIDCKHPGKARLVGSVRDRPRQLTFEGPQL